MRLSPWSLALGAAASLLSSASAGTTSSCPSGADNVCYEWGVPESSAKQGTGDIFFQLKAPTKYQWIATGIGQRMLNAQIFMIYQDGKGNVTLSTRKGRNHIMPLHEERNDVTLLEGSGVKDGNMVANIKCSACDDLDLSGETGWIAAWKTGDALNTTDPSATVEMHDSMTVFHVDFSKASISSDANPFLSSSKSGGSSSGDSDGDSDGDSGSGGVVEDDDDDDSNTLPYAHGIIMSLVFVLGYPMGSFLMPLFGKWYIHAGWQSIVFLAMWAGFGIGYTVARQEDLFFTERHTRLGVIVVSLMGIQPILGWLHHAQFKKVGKRTVSSYIHIWYGRCLMVLGIVNGGLGLDLALGPRSWIIAYSVVAGVIGLVYIAFMMAGAFGLANQRGRDNSAEKRAASDHAASREV